jgi:hypothetical protein
LRRRIRRRGEANANLVISEWTKNEPEKIPTQKNSEKSLTDLEKSAIIVKKSAMHTLWGFDLSSIANA